MRQTMISCIIILSIFSCKKDDNTVTVHTLKNCAIEYLNFRDDNKYYYNSSMSFPPNDLLKTIVSFQYNTNRVNQVTGGFMNVPIGNNFGHLLFSVEVYDSIVYDRNNIFVYTKPDAIYSALASDNPKNPTVYINDSKSKLIKIVRRDGFEINYTYQNNQIIETNDTGKILRNFYFEDNNLVRITREIGDTSDQHYLKKEFLFQDYDNQPNPLKNMYHLTGAFYRSFSENNYSKFSVNEYRHLENGKIGITSTGWCSMPIEYTTDGYPKFGDYEE